MLSLLIIFERCKMKITVIDFSFTRVASSLNFYSNRVPSKWWGTMTKLSSRCYRDKNVVSIQF